MVFTILFVVNPVFLCGGNWITTVAKLDPLIRTAWYLYSVTQNDRPSVTMLYITQWQDERLNTEDKTALVFFTVCDQSDLLSEWSKKLPASKRAWYENPVEELINILENVLIKLNLKRGKLLLPASSLYAELYVNSHTREWYWNFHQIFRKKDGKFNIQTVELFL